MMWFPFVISIVSILAIALGNNITSQKPGFSEKPGFYSSDK
ncbi:MAG: hypothetical protein VKK42_11820 [Lyngbya sp.]|nr:hypothetical protein [Lyngbya sp.]